MFNVVLMIWWIIIGVVVVTKGEISKLEYLTLLFAYLTQLLEHAIYDDKKMRW
jgi:hypothetical protein